MSLEPIAPGELLPEATLEDCERLFREGERAEKRGQLAQAVALKHIRDNGLHESYGTFKKYVEDRLGYTEQWAYARISLADIVGELNHGLVGVPAVTNERQARAIRPVLRDHGPEVAAEVLREAADESGNLTARAITEATPRVVRPTVVSDPEPVEVLTVEQWCERNGHEQIATDLSEDDLTPADLQFKRDFWRHMKVTHDLLMDMDFPHYFDADMSARLADFVQTIAAKHDRFAKSKNGLRVVQGGR